MSKTTISNSRIRIKPSNALLELLNKYKEEITEIPTNLVTALKFHGFSLSTTVEILGEEIEMKQPAIDIALLKQVRKQPLSITHEVDQNVKDPLKYDESAKKSSDNKDTYLNLSDLRWINEFLIKLRKERDVKFYLNDFLEQSTLILPENEIIERNPELEARCEKLRLAQQNREYMKMTKNVDSVLKNYPEDTIAYQMKAINRQIIAVFQFVLSVVAGFVFGFLGIELIVGGLDFGLRLLLGIMFALIIALAEIYFLAKKLNEYDDVVSTASKHPQTPIKSKKVHTE